MKLAGAAVLGAAALLQVGARDFSANPVARIVQLLKSLQQDVEKELQHEQELYDNFRCWGKKVLTAKAASNEQAQSRKDSLEAYVADLDAGKIELTTERVDLEKELAGLAADIETAEALRAKEHADFLAAEGEMEKAVAALTEAVEVLSEATTKKEAGLLALRRPAPSFGAQAAHAQALAMAIEVGNRFLPRSDALFLQRILVGEVPQADWKKLNQKADFKMEYKARSGNIQKTLAGLLKTFSTNLAEAQAQEAKAASLHETLITAKKDQKSKAEDALSKLDLENTARGASKAQAEEELAALKTQIESDKGFIAQTEQALTDKEKEWAERKTTRTGELKALGEAISILYSDDARDLMKRSHASQGYSFLQEGRQQRSAAQRTAERWEATQRGAEAILRASRAAGDDRLSLLATRVAAGGRFDKLVEAIDTMIETLKAEEASDLTKKETCESDRAADTRSAIVTGRAMDDLSDTMAKLRAEVAELDTQVSAKQKEIKDVEAQLAEATKDREAEHEDWVRSDKDDEEAEKLVLQAKTVLETFYSEKASAGSLLQGHRQEPEVQAGQAPPPPPSTWTGAYAGKQKENKSVSAILELVAEDIADDRAAAKESEDKAQAAFEKVKEESAAQVASLESSVAELTGAKAGKEEAVETTDGERRTKKGELDASLAKIQAANAGCDFFTLHFDTRTSNRHTEIDGLQNAKVILQRVTFPEEGLLQRTVAKHQVAM